MVLDGIVNTLFNPDKGLPMDTPKQRKEFWEKEHKVQSALEQFEDYNTDSAEYEKIKDNNSGKGLKDREMPHRQHI